MTHASREEKAPGKDPAARRPVRSFVLRAGRLTDGQKRALEQLWPVYGVPDGADELNFRTLFGNRKDVILEIGFGDGNASWQMALAHPEENYLGVEVHRPGVGRLLLKIESLGLGNVRVACEDAVELLDRRIPGESLAGVRIYFPDPWPKKRHHKRRMIQPPFAALLAGRMKAGAVLHLATDWEPYAQHILEVMGQSGDFVNLASGGGFSPKPEWRPATKYEKRGKRLGHGVYDLLYRRAA